MILNTKDLTTIPKDTNPLYADGFYFVKIRDLKLESSAAGKKMLKIQLSVAGEEIPLRNGGSIKNNGRILFDQVFMETTENWDPDVKIAEIARAVKFDGEHVAMENLKDQWVKIKLGYKAAKDEYPEANVVKKYYPIEEKDGFNPPV